MPVFASSMDGIGIQFSNTWLEWYDDCNSIMIRVILSKTLRKAMVVFVTKAFKIHLARH